MQLPPYQPGPPPPQPYQPGSMPIVSPPRKKVRRSTWLLGCGGLILALMICALFGVISSANTSQPTAQTDPTPTEAGSHLVVKMTVHSPTAVTEKPTVPPVQPTPKPTEVPPVTQPAPQPTEAPPVTQPAPTGINGNPWGYDFNQGTVITSPPAGFCNLFSCIANFNNGKGYVIECSDGMYSLSGGRQGSCSHNGGDKQILYAHG